jgi:hypothetical protein
MVLPLHAPQPQRAGGGVELELGVVPGEELHLPESRYRAVREPLESRCRAVREPPESRVGEPPESRQRAVREPLEP